MADVVRETVRVYDVGPMPKPIVEAILLVERVERRADGLFVLDGILGPRLVFTSFPVSGLQWHVYLQFREIQSPEDALKLEIQVTYGLDGNQIGRQNIFGLGQLPRVTPFQTVSTYVHFPPATVSGPCILTYRVLFEREELARTMIEMTSP